MIICVLLVYCIFLQFFLLFFLFLFPEYQPRDWLKLPILYQVGCKTSTRSMNSVVCLLITGTSRLYFCTENANKSVWNNAKQCRKSTSLKHEQERLTYTVLQKTGPLWVEQGAKYFTR